MGRFLAAFALVAGVAYTVAYLPPVREHVIGPFTFAITDVAGLLIGGLGGQATVSGNILAIPGFSVQVLDLCNGVEATILLWAALLAFTAPWRYRLKGLLLGTFTVHGLNIVRIVSLVYLGAWDRALFHWAHWYVWDALIMADVLLVFLAWLRWMPVPDGKDDAVAA